MGRKKRRVINDPAAETVVSTTTEQDAVATENVTTEETKPELEVSKADSSVEEKETAAEVTQPTTEEKTKVKRTTRTTQGENDLVLQLQQQLKSEREEATVLAQKNQVLEQKCQEQDKLIAELQAKLKTAESKAQKAQAVDTKEQDKLIAQLQKQLQTLETQVQSSKSIDEKVQQQERLIAQLQSDLQTERGRTFAHQQQYRDLQAQYQLQMNNVADLQQYIAESSSVLGIAEAQLNKWRKRTFFG